MNIFVPQSIQAYIELAEIADVKRQIISPRNSSPIIGAVQDGLLGAYNLTAPNMRIEWKDAMNIISYSSIDDLSSFKKNIQYKGQDIFSLIIPSNINVNNDNQKIDDGKIVLGQINKDLLGNKPNSLIHLIWDEYGVDEAKRFLDDTARIVNNFNLLNGFSVGIGDIDISDDLQKEMTQLFETKKLEVDHLITDMENNPDLLDKDIFEDSINNELNAIRENVSKLIMNNLKPMNNFNIMITSGSKGGPINMGQMGGCVGQQVVEGKRIRKRVNSRSLPYFFQNDDSAFARGFIETPFVSGVHPIEFIFHNMTGREGLIDTAIKTAESGYIQRKLIKSMEDAMIKYDGTVRNANNTILQFIYGDDGVDTTKQYAHNLVILKMGNKEVEQKYTFTKEEMGNFKKFSAKDNDSLYEEIIYLRDLIRGTQVRTAFMALGVLETKFYIPVNIVRIVNNIKVTGTSKNNLDPNYVVDRIEDMVQFANTQVTCMSSNNAKNKKSLKYKDDLLSKSVMKLALYQFIGPKQSIFKLKLNKESFDSLCELIIENFNKNMIEAGEMVGTIAAQSIGEPVTQMTLNVFHSAGIAGSITSSGGVPRIKELLSFSKNLKTPRMYVYLNKDYRNNASLTNKIASYIKYTTIKDIRDRVDIYYDPLPKDKGGFMEQDGVYNVFSSYNPSKYSCQNEVDSLPWLMRIEFNKEKMMNKDITLLDIKSKFCNQWEKRYKDIKSVKKEEKQLLEKISQCSVLSNNDNDSVPIIHIRFDMVNFDFNTIINFLDVFVDNFKLKGLKDIDDILDVVPQKIVNFDNDDAELVAEEQNIIYTKGVNMIGIRYINGINLAKTLTNDVVDVYEKFGIEAARAVLIKEIKLVFESSGSPVNSQHLAILVDIMTNNGTLTSIDRHGLNRLETDPLARASFEKTVDQLLTSAVFGEIDHMNSVSSRIMGGLVIRGGTGLCDIVLDTKLLENSEYVDDIEHKYKKTFLELNQNALIDDIIKKDTSEFFMPT
jgi:DNA-directed RNA polymerase II subunit RPB1